MCNCLFPVLILVEGAHDKIFFRKLIESHGGPNLKVVKPLEAEHQIRNRFRGALITDCGGIPNLYKVINRLMRQIIVSLSLPLPRLHAIGDSDRFSTGSILHNLNSYLGTPCKAHNLVFEVGQTGTVVSLAESTKRRQLEINCQIVPGNLESQIYDKIPQNIKQHLPPDASIESKLKNAAELLDLPSLDSLIEESAEWLSSAEWVVDARRKIIADCHI